VTAITAVNVLRSAICEELARHRPSPTGSGPDDAGTPGAVGCTAQACAGCGHMDGHAVRYPCDVRRRLLAALDAAAAPEASEYDRLAEKWVQEMKGTPVLTVLEEVRVTPLHDPVGDAAWWTVWKSTAGTWRHVTADMDLAQREHAAKAVVRHARHLHGVYGHRARWREPSGLRWWSPTPVDWARAVRAALSVGGPVPRLRDLAQYEPGGSESRD
jgi:hypothetical protein